MGSTVELINLIVLPFFFDFFNDIKTMEVIYCKIRLNV